MWYKTHTRNMIELNFIVRGVYISRLYKFALISNSFLFITQDNYEKTVSIILTNPYVIGCVDSQNKNKKVISNFNIKYKNMLT